MWSTPNRSQHLNSVLDPRTPLSQAFRDAISTEVRAFLAEQSGVLDSMGPELVPVQLMANQLLCGGKRIRPAFCVWGYVAARGMPDAAAHQTLLTAAASLDVLHGSALVHDDVMDSSDLRRGRPAAHRQFEALHANAGWLGDSAAFGKAGAIVLGDLLVMWSAQMLHTAGLDQTALERALPIVEAMRTEVTCGQYLDIVAQAHPLRQTAPASGALRPNIELALDDASRVVEYKAARYTVQRPCQIGAALGGGDDHLYYALGAYGSPLGRAFQFRDDLLGVFGDTQLTGQAQRRRSPRGQAHGAGGPRVRARQRDRAEPAGAAAGRPGPGCRRGGAVAGGDHRIGGPGGGRGDDHRRPRPGA